MRFLHCAADGSAKVLDDGAVLSDDVAVLPYEDGMKVVVRAALANGVKRCATATVAGMASGETRPIANLAAAGKGCIVRHQGWAGKRRGLCTCGSEDGDCRQSICRRR